MIKILNISGVSIEEAEADAREIRKSSFLSKADIERVESAGALVTANHKGAASEAGRERAKSEHPPKMISVIRPKKKLKKKKRRRRSGKLDPSSRANKQEWRFIRAARHARKNALAVSETAVLLKLHALFMQSTVGDCPPTKAAVCSAQADEDPLEELKRARWASLRGTDRGQAMRDYVAEIDALFPGWSRMQLRNISATAKDETSTTMVGLLCESKLDTQDLLTDICCSHASLNFRSGAFASSSEGERFQRFTSYETTSRARR